MSKEDNMPYETPGPQDRTTRLADAALEGFRHSPDFQEGDKAIVLVHGADNVGGMVMGGYTKDDDIVEEFQTFMKAYLYSQGMGIAFIHPSDLN